MGLRGTGCEIPTSEPEEPSQLYFFNFYFCRFGARTVANPGEDYIREKELKARLAVPLRGRGRLRFEQCTHFLAAHELMLERWINK